MGKGWDTFPTRKRAGSSPFSDGRARPGISEGQEYRKSDRAPFIGFMTITLAECLRLAKPGAHALVWALPRTSHWTATAIEDAGWDIRDVVTSITGQGFPKSLNIAKAFGAMGEADLAKQWKGWGTALKPAAEHWILARKPIAGNVANNVREHGTGGLHVAACKVGTNVETWPSSRGYSRRETGSPIKATQPTGDPPQGRYPPNLVLTHHPDCVPCGTRRVKGGNDPRKADGTRSQSVSEGWDRPWRHREQRLENHVGYAGPDGMETVPAWRCVEGCPVAELDRQSGTLATHAGTARTRHKAGMYGPETNPGRVLSNGNTGGASRFFPQFSWSEGDFAPFLYCAKASRRDRGEGNTHPTVKPTSLCAWLARLICPPDGVVLDPFMGSASIGVACVREGFGYVGIESDPDYFAIAERRIHAAAPVEVA